MSSVVAHLNDNFDRDFPRFPRPVEHLILQEHSDKDRGIHLIFTSQREMIKTLKVTNIDLFTQKSSLPTYSIASVERMCVSLMKTKSRHRMHDATAVKAGLID